MPRFAANLGHLFTEYPLMERFGAAAACGFAAVELQFPYDIPARHGEGGTREARPDAARRQHAARPGIRPCRAARTRARLRCRIRPRARLRHRHRRHGDPLHGRRRPGQRAAGGGKSLHRQHDARRRGGGQSEHHAVDRADQSARPAGLFPEPRRARRRSRRQDRRAESARAVRFLSYSDRRRRSDQAVREISAGGRSRADRRGADARRARRGRDRLSGDVRGDRQARLCRLDRLRI